MAMYHRDWLRSLAAVLAISLSPSIAAAQGSDTRASAFDVSAGAGIAYGTRWFESGEHGGEIGRGLSVGVAAHYWVTPTLGARVHASYSRNALRTSAEGSRPLDIVAYDASVVVRPFGWASSPYAFAGGGQLLAAVHDDESAGDPECAASFQADGLCVPRRLSDGKRIQLTVGAGADIAQVGWNTFLFVEGSLHVYRPPIDRLSGESGIAQMPAASTASVAATGRLVVGLRRSYGNLLPPPVPPLPPPPPVAPATGGRLRVTTTVPGADVYLIPLTYFEDHPSVVCQLRAGGGTFYRGRTPGIFSVENDTHVLIIRQGGRQYKNENIQLSGGETDQININMTVQGSPYRCP